MRHMFELEKLNKLMIGIFKHMLEGNEISKIGNISNKL